MLKVIKESFVELNARERTSKLLDQGTYFELLDPFEEFESPHLEHQSIVPQSDDGIVVTKGEINQEPVVIISMEGNFQGGAIGEVSGAKIAGALELALLDNKKGIRTRPIIIYDTGGVRLQEANHGLLAIAEISDAIVALREYVPVVGIIPGKIGCFGGMSLTAGLCSTLVMTKEGRLTLNGPEVIEQEAGIEEFDSQDRRFIWKTIGGEQRHSMGFVDHLVDDDMESIKEVIVEHLDFQSHQVIRSEQVDLYRSRLQMLLDPSHLFSPTDISRWWNEKPSEDVLGARKKHSEADFDDSSKGRIWFNSLTDQTENSGVDSVYCADETIGSERIRYIAVVPDSNNRFPRARKGEVGLEEGWAIAQYVRDAIEQDKDGNRRAIVAIVDVPSQAYGYNEELLGIHQAGAAAVNAYASARRAGHPVITLIVGNAISGGFLTHGLQSHYILALNDEGVNVHVMSKQSAARITRRSIEELEEATKKAPAMAYDVQSFATLGALHELIDGVNAKSPTGTDIEKIKEKITSAILSARSAPDDLSNRLQSSQAQVGRKESIKVRNRMSELWG